MTFIYLPVIISPGSTRTVLIRNRKGLKNDVTVFGNRLKRYRLF